MDTTITECLALLKAGNRDRAAIRLFESYFRPLVSLARARLRAAPRRMADEEDVALSALDSFFRRAERGLAEEISDRQGLWQLLFLITERKVIDAINHERRQRRDHRRARAFSELADHEIDTYLSTNPSPPPDLALEVNDEFHRLIGVLDESNRLQSVARWKLEGYTNDEIARKLNVVPSTVERKLRKIRTRWRESFPELQDYGMPAAVEAVG